MVQDGGKKKKNKNKKNKNKQNPTNTDQEQSSTFQQHAASPALVDQGAVADPVVDESFEIVSNEEPTANTNTNTTKLEIVNGLFSNSCTNQFDEKTNNKNTALKCLALEAKEWIGYDFAAIHDAETKYHMYLAKKQKVNYCIFSIYPKKVFFLNIMPKNSEKLNISKNNISEGSSKGRR